ncbi:ATP-dependent DNA ligase [Sphingomonas sp. S6]|uniref:ATP-dependent DNA ligase n=1 Tax=Sphingomonas sp. S6 TaxID=3368600 RepID=UPI0028EA9ADB|nr:ATP-dependent DNA ligase [uncultured Sphingomonas sp.]
MLATDLSPMEAKQVSDLPDDEGWQFEPKWDGFRALIFRQGDEVEIMSKSGKPLSRYFPDVVRVIRQVDCPAFVLDGELILPIGDVLSFDALQARLHPAASRIERLSRETPAQVMLFDCLMVDGEELLERPLGERRFLLEAFHRSHGGPSMLLSDRTSDISVAKEWLSLGGGALDGVVAKRIDEPYRSGERAMLKVKQHRTADCVVGGFRRVKEGEGVASLLLGLYDDAGLLNHVGFTSGIAAGERLDMLRRLEPLIEAPGFTGKAPGGPSRWNDGKESEWEPLRSELVVEVLYDQVTGDRFRHGTRLLRWRQDKAPGQCRMEQMIHEVRSAELATMGHAPRRPK